MSILEEKVDRLENHFAVYKKDMVDVKEVAKDIRNLLTGTDLNGHKGVVHILDKLEQKVDDLEAKQILIDDNMNNVKFVAKGVITAIIGFLAWLFSNK